MVPNVSELTGRQKYLLSLTDEEIEERTNVFSFDRDEFISKVSTGDQWVRLIAGHLYLDHVLTFMLSDGLAIPDAIDAKRLSFSQRLQMCAALGLIPEGEVRAIEKVNSLRNKLAHSLSFRIEDREVQELANCTSKRIRDALKAEKNRNKGPLELSELLTGIVYRTEIIRQSNAVGRLKTEKASARLREVLNRTKPIPEAVSSPIEE